MKRLTTTSLVLVLMAAITEGAIGVLVASAQEKKEVYVPTADMRRSSTKAPSRRGREACHDRSRSVHGPFGAALSYRPVYVYVLEAAPRSTSKEARQTFTVGISTRSRSARRCRRATSVCRSTEGPVLPGARRR